MNSPHKPGAPESWPPPSGDDPKPKIQLSGRNWLGMAGVFFLILIALAFATGRLGITTISDTQVAVLVNYVGGKKEVITNPGIKIYMPAIQEVFLFDRRSQEFKMQGDRFVNANHVPKLTVRANDGSSFFFEELTILYEIIAGDADKILEDSGSGEGFKQNWIKAYARSILRDEFGRYSAVDAADPTQFTLAAVATRERLNILLNPHGLQITKVITPKPKFDVLYERAIEDRKEADQEVQGLRARQEQLVEARKKDLSAVAKVKEIEMTSLVGDLRKELLSAEQEAIRIKASAEAFAIEKRLEGEGFLAERVAQARGLEAKYTKEAEGLESKVKALENRGEVVVREALIAKLGTIKFSFLPYSRDPEPKRLEHVQSTGDLGSMIDEESLTEDN
jgi:hypothetical protein